VNPLLAYYLETLNMKNFCVDLHCHSHSKAYAHAFKFPGPPYLNSADANKPNSTWWSDWPTPEDIDRNVNGLLGLTTFTQSDFKKCVDGRVGVVFTSLNQFEKGFTKTRFIKKKLTDWAIGKVTEFEKERLKFVRTKLDDYFTDVTNEYEFLKSKSGFIKTITGSTYRYQLVNNFQQLNSLLNQQDVDHQVCVINTIEGAQSLGTGIEPFDAFMETDKLLDRIREMKAWEFPPFFITFTHHFYNEMCGHARSLGILKLLVDQEFGIHRTFTALGMIVRDALLSTSNGKRILIDVKHMNRRSRMQYYGFIRDRDYDIPIIVSHGAVTGMGAPDTDSVLGDVKAKYASDSINFYDDELVEIERSNGIFGIQLDERRVASKSELRKIKGTIGNDLLFKTSRLIWRQVEHIAEVLDRHGEYAWALQSIGSDFDGMVNPLDGFFTSAHFKNLEHFLLMHAHNYVENHISSRMQLSENKNISADEIVRRVIRENAMNFLEANFV